MKLFLVIFTIFYTIPMHAQTSEEEAIKESINLFFRGMHEADTAMIKSVLTEKTIFHTITNNRNDPGNPGQESIPGFLKSISQLSPGDANEKIIFQSILIDGDLAHVWTPYEFFYKEKLSHTGVNSFQLVKINNSWKIVYIIDTRRKPAK